MLEMILIVFGIIIIFLCIAYVLEYFFIRNAQRTKKYFSTFFYKQWNVLFVLIPVVYLIFLYSSKVI